MPSDMGHKITFSSNFPGKKPEEETWETVEALFINCGIQKCLLFTKCKEASFP